MATTEPLKIAYGGDMMLFIDDGKPVAFSTNAKLEIKLNTRDIASKDGGYWKERLAGRLEWSASSDALYTEKLTATTTTSFDQLYNMLINRVPVTVVFGCQTGGPFVQEADAAKSNYTGQAMITGLSVNAPDGETATYSITLEGTGALLLDQAT